MMRGLWGDDGKERVADEVTFLFFPQKGVRLELVEVV